jgi:hypothetical protein
LLKVKKNDICKDMKRDVLHNNKNIITITT